MFFAEVQNVTTRQVVVRCKKLSARTPLPRPMRLEVDLAAWRCRPAVFSDVAEAPRRAGPPARSGPCRPR